MKNKSLYKSADFFQIPRPRLVIGILVGLFFAFSFYSLMYLSREAFRIMSVTETYDLWILSEDETHFYNLFFAFISVIIAQSVCFQFWLDRPGKFLQKKNYRKFVIINDQRILNWSFLSWFSKLAVAFGIMFGYTLHGAYYEFSLYPDYNFVFILIIVVLFFQTWTTIRLSFKKRSLKWMMISMLILSTTAFGLSRVNLIDYKALNHSILQKNLYLNYNLNVPKTDCYEKIQETSFVENIYVVKSKKNSDNTPKIIIDNEEISLDKLSATVKSRQAKGKEYYIYRLTYQLHIDESVRMGFVNQMKYILSKSKVIEIAYAVVPNNPKYNIQYYKDYALRYKTPNRSYAGYNVKDEFSELSKYTNLITIKLINSKTCYINNELVDYKEIKEVIRRFVAENSDYIIKYEVNDSVKFSDYFKILASAKCAVDELRNEYVETNYNEEYFLLTDKQQDMVMRKYSFRVFESTADLINSTEGNDNVQD